MNMLACAFACDTIRYQHNINVFRIANKDDKDNALSKKGLVH